MIKLIALDLDGTTLNNDGRLSEITKQTLKTAIKKGVEVVIATGRVYAALPKEILAIDGIRYCLSSNGANIINLKAKKLVYTNFIHPNIVETVVETLAKYDFMTEVFTGGHAYIERSIYKDIQKNGSGFKNTDYLLSTREPVENLFRYILGRKDFIENINLNFTDQNEKEMMKRVLEAIPGINVTSSFIYNLEICGMATSKADALNQLCKMLGLTTDELMACGDSDNDIEMLKVSGLSVAMGNANDEVKAVAKHIAPTNQENGVAWAIESFVLEKIRARPFAY